MVWLRECEAGAGHTIDMWVTLGAFVFLANGKGWVVGV